MTQKGKMFVFYTLPKNRVTMVELIITFNIIYNNASHPVTNQGWHFNRMWKNTTW